MRFIDFVKKQRINLFLIFFLGFSLLLRVWHLDTNPAGFFCDEALRGVDVLSILQTGKDSNGDFLPIFFKGFNNENVGPFNIYPLLPSVLIFGLNETAIRITPVFWGLLEIYFIYLLLNEFIPKKYSLLGTFLLTISPWHFHLGRIMFGDFYSWSLLTTLFLLCITKFLKLCKLKYLFLSSIFCGLLTYSYVPARLITPLISLSTTVIIFLFSSKKKALLFIGIYILMIIPVAFYYFKIPYSFQRLKDTTSISSSKTTQVKIIDKSFINNVWKKYLIHFQDLFLFEKGDADYPGQFIRRHSIAGLGLLYPYQKWLIIAGLIWLVYEIFFKKKTELLFVIFLLVLFPVADSLTLDKTPFATRSYLGVLPFHLLIVFGIYGIYQLLQSLHLWKYLIIKTLAMSLLAFFIITSFATLMIKFSENPLTTSNYWGWQFGPRDIITYFKEAEPDYDQLIMEPKFNAPHIFFKFYAPEGCQKCLLGDLALFDPSQKQLFALSNEYLKEHSSVSYNIKKIIYYPSGEVAFKIIEVKNL